MRRGLSKAATRAAQAKAEAAWIAEKAAMRAAHEKARAAALQVARSKAKLKVKALREAIATLRAKARGERRPLCLWRGDELLALDQQDFADAQAMAEVILEGGW